MQRELLEAILETYSKVLSELKEIRARLGSTSAPHPGPWLSGYGYLDDNRDPYSRADQAYFPVGHQSVVSRSSLGCTEHPVPYPSPFSSCSPSPAHTEESSQRRRICWTGDSTDTPSRGIPGTGIRDTPVAPAMHNTMVTSSQPSRDHFSFLTKSRYHPLPTDSQKTRRAQLAQKSKIFAMLESEIN